MKKKKSGNGNGEDSKKKERHIVTWSLEEDDTLREQISLHGTENWAIIASKFKDKTTRQCRRRWYTYLNSDFKKGGWSPEEDLLLCEAQRVFGNRWTEIAKVVSGRTDNAVKNRFTTLCKKRAKFEAMAKENKNACVNSNNKRVSLFPEEMSSEREPGNEASVKRMRRSHILDLTAINGVDRSHKKCESAAEQQIRPPFSVLSEDHVIVNDDSNKNMQGEFIKKDDPKIVALMEQAELLKSLALKVNADKTEQSMENAWKVLQDFLNKNKEHEIFRYGMPDIDFQLEEFKDLVDEDIRCSNEESQLSWRQPGLYESPASSEYSTGSTNMPNPAVDKIEQSQAETHQIHKEDMSDGQEVHVNQETGFVSEPNIEEEPIHVKQEPGIVSGGEIDQVNVISEDHEFSSPLHVTPLFRTLAAEIPSPQFSESERSFLLKTLGIESPSLCPSANPSQTQTCKRVLLHNL